MEKTIQEDREENPNSKLTIKDLVTEQIEAHLTKKPIQLGSELYTYAYQWSDWNGGVNSKASPTLTRISQLTFSKGFWQKRPCTQHFRKWPFDSAGGVQ